MSRRQAVIIVAFLFSICLVGQDLKNTELHIGDSNLIQEKIEVLTDRAIYIASEEICFQLIYSTNINLNNNKWSSVVYIELIKPDGTPVQQNKLKLEDENLANTITVPVNIPSGYYYVKAYTKWMRNFPASNYGYALVKVINPKKSLFETDKKNQAGNELKLKQISQEDKSLNILIDKTSYSKREKVNVTLSHNGFSEKEANYSISVTRKGMEQVSTLRPEEKTDMIVNTKYLPELFGLTITGRINNPTNSDSMEGVTLNMSLINSKIYFSAYETKENGSFYFNVPETFHTLDCYLMVDSDYEHLEIIIDSEYCQKEVNLPTPEFKLDDKMMELAKELSVNTQLSNLFNENTEVTLSNNIDELSQITFYGSPHYTFYTKDYINLPLISEFIFEIIPQLAVTNGSNKVTIRSKKPNSLSSYPYLVLMDNIIVTELNELLKRRTNQIEKIELIERGYAIGDMKYGGIFHLKTKQKDFAGMDLPDNSIFFSFDTYSENSIKEVKVVEDHLPDRRNILYWNPEFKYKSGSENKFSFQTADVTGEYLILIKKVSEHTGEIEYAMKEFIIQ